MYDWFVPVLLVCTFALILATVFLQIALDAFKRKKYDDPAPPAHGPRRPAS